MFKMSSVMMADNDLDCNSTIPNLSGVVHKQDARCFAIGEVSDVYKCVLRTSDTDRIVAVKVMRGVASHESAQISFRQQLSQLLLQWQCLDHPNIMPCLGICNHIGPQTGLVLPMCFHGSIMQYLGNNPSVDKLGMLLQIASGVSYLHSQRFVHADIRGSNILISPEGVPLLMDGGLSVIVSHGDFTVAGLCGKCRWMAPEVLDPSDDIIDDEESPFTAASDIYSLGMTILEVMTGKIPFNHRRYDTVVIFDVIRGVRPPRPDAPTISDHVWNIIRACWGMIPDSRPVATSVEAWLKLAQSMDAIGARMLGGGTRSDAHASDI